MVSFELTDEQREIRDWVHAFATSTQSWWSSSKPSTGMVGWKSIDPSGSSR